MNTEKFELAGSKKCKEVLNQYPDYKVFWRSGFAYRGKGEAELDRNGVYPVSYPRRDVLTFEQYMDRNLDWAAATDIEIHHDLKELHFNGFSENDLY